MSWRFSKRGLESIRHDVVKVVSVRGVHGRLARGSVASFALKITGITLSFVVAAVLARSLGQAGYGIYAYVFSLISVLAVPAMFGLPNLVVREVARAHVRESWGQLRGVIRWSNGISAAFALAVFVIAIITVSVQESLAPVQVKTFLWGVMLIPLIVLGELRGAALRGLGHVIQGQLPERVLRPGLLILAVGGR